METQRRRKAGEQAGFLLTLLSVLRILWPGYPGRTVKELRSAMKTASTKKPTQAQTVQRSSRRVGRNSISLEDLRDLKEAERRLADPKEKPIPYEKVRREIGLD